MSYTLDFINAIYVLALTAGNGNLVFIAPSNIDFSSMGLCSPHSLTSNDKYAYNCITEKCAIEAVLNFIMDHKKDFANPNSERTN